MAIGSNMQSSNISTLHPLKYSDFGLVIFPPIHKKFIVVITSILLKTTSFPTAQITFLFAFHLLVTVLSFLSIF